MDIISFLKIGQMILLIVIVLILLLVVIVQTRNNEQFVTEKIQRLIKESGGTSTKIKRVSRHKKGGYHFSVDYKDRDEQLCTVQVTQHVSFLGHFKGDLSWSRSLEMALAQALIGDPKQSKEQIISEMDAEIRRLRGALAVAGGDDLPKSERSYTK